MNLATSILGLVTPGHHSDVVFQGRVHRVPDPTVGTALVVLSALAEAWRAQGDGTDNGPGPGDEAVDVLKATTKAWLPRRLHRALFPSRWRMACRRVRRWWDGTPVDGPAAGLTALGLLVAPPGSLPDDKPTDGTDPEPDGAAERLGRDWTLALATYCNAYGVPPETALDHAWPLFLVTSQAASALDARAQLRDVEVRAVGKLETEADNAELLDSLQRRAWSPGKTERPAGKAPAMSEDEQRAQLARIRLLMGPASVPGAPAQA